MFIVGQILGGIALILSIFQFFSKSRFIYLFYAIFVNIALSIEYLVLGSYAGMYLCAFASIRYIVYIFKGKNKFFSGIWIPMFFVLSNILITIFTFDKWFDILPGISGVIVSIYPWFDDVDIMRYCSLSISILWITYDICLKAYVSLCSEIIWFVVALVGVVVIITKKRKVILQKKQENNNVFIK
jgi:hypothetical protein